MIDLPEGLDLDYFSLRAEIARGDARLAPSDQDDVIFRALARTYQTGGME